MARHQRLPYDEFQTLYGRCSVCGTYNKFGRSPSGGRYYPPHIVEGTDATTGKLFYTDNASTQGCMFCGSPAWQGGGKAGDLKVSRW
jgi:hypothetical protein